MGYWNMGNKGSQSVFVKFFGKFFQFTNLHLSSGFGEIAKQNRLFELNNVVIFNREESEGISTDFSEVFLGDFNFKINRIKEEVTSLISQHKEKVYEHLKQFDEFNEIKEKHEKFSNFREVSINFLPSYKYNKNTKFLE